MVKETVKGHAKQIRGVSYKPNDLHGSLDDNSVILLRANNIDDGKINFDDVVYVDKSKVSNEQYLKRGDVLICASSGSKQLVGKAASVDFDTPCTFGAFCKVVRPNTGWADYLGIYFQSNAYRREISSLAIGANINNIRNEHVDCLTLNIWSEDKQKRIVNQMSKLKGIIDKRKDELAKMDELIKARFVEMFGDPKVNNKGFVKAPMGNYMTLLTDFSSNGSYKTLDSGVTMYDEPNFAWMVRTTDLESGDMSSIKYIDEQAYELLSKSKIFGGEIIMNKIGSAGKVYLMPEINMPASLGRNAFMFRYDDRINVRFLYEQLVSEYGQSEIQQYVRGAVTKTITKDDARAVKIIVPDKSLQDEFVGIVKQVDKSKSAVQRSLLETQLLYDSLMQQYFD